MKIKYVGMFAAVGVPYIEDNIEKRLDFERGAIVECPDELAVRLLEQPDNYQAESPSRGRAKT